MTQQNTWASDVDPQASDWHWLRWWNGKTFSEEPMHAALEEYNQATRDVGARLDVPVYDFARTAPSQSGISTTTFIST